LSNPSNIWNEIGSFPGNGYHLSLQATLDYSDQSTIRQLLDRIASRPKRKGFQPAGFGIEDMMTRMKNIVQGYDYCIKTAKFKWIDYSKMLPGKFKIDSFHQKLLFQVIGKPKQDCYTICETKGMFCNPEMLALTRAPLTASY